MQAAGTRANYILDLFVKNCVVVCFVQFGKSLKIQFKVLALLYLPWSFPRGESFLDSSICQKHLKANVLAQTVRVGTSNSQTGKPGKKEAEKYIWEKGDLKSSHTRKTRRPCVYLGPNTCLKNM